DLVDAAKEVVKLTEDDEFAPFLIRGGSMDGETLTPEKVKEVSTWPSRTEMLSILSGQLLAPGANISGALIAPGGELASQIQQKSEGAEEEAEAAAEEG
ncbi:MAG: hypothetical protein N2C14_05330, partial [Planctomycetales bacterium]